MSDSTHGNLCRVCGFCCDGTFFGRGPLMPEEVPQARASGLKILSQDDAVAFEQPCARHEGEQCGIYATRPACCRAYRCRLLHHVEAGDVAFETAEGYIARVRDLAERLRAATVETHEGGALFAAAMDLAEAAKSADWRREHASLLLDLGEFVQLCRRHFGVRDNSPPMQG